MIIDSNNIKEENYIKDFISKKNNVQLYEVLDHVDKKHYFVSKKFNNDDSYNTELNIYERLNSVVDEKDCPLYYPRMLGYNRKNRILILEYIRGKNVLELLEYYESNNWVKQSGMLLMQVLEWLDGFYNAIEITGDEVFGDINLRNFILTDKGVCGVDFENVSHGNREFELIGVLAMYLLYNPIESEVKKSVVEIVRKTYLENRLSFENKKKFTTIIKSEMDRIISNRIERNKHR